ncbi:MAG: YceD family protein [Actinomycetia bacterium]|nr:YceD family protein [Actinomycetes bacterium]
MIRSPFLVDVSDMLGRDVPARSVVIDVVVDWALQMSKIMVEPPLVADLAVAPIPGGILVRGEVCYAVEHACRRCLTDFIDDGCSPVAGLFEIDPGEDAYPIDGTTIDLEPFLRDETLLGLPLLPLCEESCEGVVTTAGIDLNTESSDDSDDTGSPFAVLRDLLPPED